MMRIVSVNPGTPRAEHRFLVTGAKGFLGAWVVKNLIVRGNCPSIFDTETSSHRLEALLCREQKNRLP